MPKKSFAFVFFIAIIFAVGSALAQTNIADITQKISIHGKDFYKDESPGKSKAVDVNAFVKPPKYFSFDKSAQLQRSYWGATELKIVKEKFGADTLRFHISQAGLDPEASLYNPVYVSQIVEPVQYARQSGFAVHIVMDAQQDGTPDLKCMPSSSTARAWKMLVPSLPKDEAIILELFNEPCKKVDRKSGRNQCRH